MKHMRLIVLVVVGVAAVGGALVYKQQHNGAKAGQFKAKAEEMVKLADAYKKDPEYVASLMQAGFGPAEKAGGGLFSGFDEDRYFSALFQSMVDQAKKDGRPEVAKLIRNFAVGKNYTGVNDR